MMIRALCAAAFVFAVGCGVPSSELSTDESFGDELADTATDLSTTSDSFVIVRHDQRRCVSPKCGGYMIRDLNSTMAEKYVNSFEFFDDTLTQDLQDLVRGSPDNEVIVFGRYGAKEKQFSTRSFIVKEAYRALPGLPKASTDKFYTVGQTKIACFTTPCANLQATKLNRATGHAMATEVNLDNALLPFVDGFWVNNRVLFHGAIIGGVITKKKGHVIVNANQVFIRLPDRLTGCPKAPPALCSPTTYPTWERTEDRCVVPGACLPQRFCPQYIPSCEQGYSLVTWNAGCTAFACDPDFLQ